MLKTFWKQWVFLFLMLPMFFVSAVEKRKTPRNFTTSIIIPCHPLHIDFLEPLLKRYSEQTVLPDEILVSISEKERADPEKIKKIEKTPWPFRLKILLSSERLFPGANRNRACSIASKDLVICQDVDDTPHPKRIEVIKEVFSKYKIIHLIHRYNGKKFSENSLEKNYKLYPLKNAHAAFSIRDRVHFGQCAFLRKVFQRIRWPEDICVWEDISFTNRVIRAFSSSVLLDAELLICKTSFLPEKVIKGIEYD